MINKKIKLAKLLQVLITPIIIIFVGVTFSLVTGYTSNNHILLIRIIVWILNFILSWIISTMFLKIFFNKKVCLFSYNTAIFSYLVSLLVIYLMGYGDNDYSYVTSGIILISIVGVFSAVKSRNDKNNFKEIHKQ